ncbi:MAG: hypothetical protein IPH42_10950 [Bacteroidetes bacterium]|nr:hypothetical protein [Bacteroidota bacterium]
MKNLKQFIFIALTLIALNSCKTPNEDKDDESQKSQSDQSIEEINHADILHNSSRLENDLFNKKLLQGGNLTLFSVIDAKPNTVFSFTFYGNIQPDNLRQ